MSEDTSKPAARTRTYVYTVQNLSMMDYIAVENYNEDQVDWCVVAEETGDKEGKRHFQAAIRFKHGKSWKAAFKFLGLKGGDNLETMRSAEFSASAYCLKGVQSKDEWSSDGVDGETYGMRLNLVRQIGTLPLRGEAKESVWDNIIQYIKMGWSDLEIVEKYPAQALRCQSAIAQYRLKHDLATAQWREVETIYINGTTGTGKSRYVMEKHGYANVYRVQNYDSGAFDMYDGQPVVLFEEFRNGFKIEQMLNFLDGYPLQLPARYANKMAKFTKVYIATNWDILEQYKGVQQNHPLTWEAFLRRIDGRAEIVDGDVRTTMANGELRLEQLPWLGQFEAVLPAE